MAGKFQMTLSGEGSYVQVDFLHGQCSAMIKLMTEVIL